MRAARYEGPEKGMIFSRTVPEPELREGEALLKPTRVGIGFAELEMARIRPDAPPITIGHEFVAIVEKINPSPAQRERYAPLIGKRVVGSINGICGECERCKGGLSSHCISRTVLGIHGRDGCFADRFTLPLSNLHPVPHDVDDDHAVMAEPLAAALHASQQLRIEGKPYITILGDGRMGLLCAQLMSRLNASVRVVGKHESKLELCAKWGIKHRHERDVGRRADQDVVVDCSGSPEGFELALKFVRPRGKVLVKGAIHPILASRSGADLSMIATKEVDVIGSRCGSMAEAIAALKRREIDVVSLISRRMKLDDATEAIRAAARPEVIKLVLDC